MIRYVFGTNELPITPLVALEGDAQRPARVRAAAKRAVVVACVVDELPITPPAAALEDDARLPHQHQYIGSPTVHLIWMVEDGATAFPVEPDVGWIPRARPRSPVRRERTLSTDELPTPPAPPFGLEADRAPSSFVRSSSIDVRRRRRCVGRDGRGSELVQPPAPFGLDEANWFVLRRPAASPPRRLAIGTDDELVPPPELFGLEGEHWLPWRRPRTIARAVPARVVVTEEEWVAAPAPFALEDDWSRPARVTRPVRRVVPPVWGDVDGGILLAPPAPQWTLVVLRSLSGPRLFGTCLSGPRSLIRRIGMPDTLVSLSDDHTIEYALRRRNEQTRAEEPAAGVTGVQGWLSLAWNGDDVGGTTVALVEAAQKPGQIFGVIDRSAVAAALASQAGPVYEVLDDGQGFRRSRGPLQIVAARKA